MTTAIYTKGDFTSTRIVDYWVEYPFSDFGDTSTKIYKFRCQVNAGNYATLSKGSSMAGAISMGVIETPITDSTARFCSDQGFASSSGGVIEFVRTFANIPQSRTDYSSGTYTSPPEYDSERIITLYSSITGNPIRTARRYYVKTSARTTVVGARLEYSYTTLPNSINILTQEGFEIIKEEPRGFYEATYGQFVVQEEDNGAVSIIQTGDANVIEGTKVKQWMGDIYEVVTTYKI